MSKRLNAQSGATTRVMPQLGYVLTSFSCFAVLNNIIAARHGTSVIVGVSRIT